VLRGVGQPLLRWWRRGLRIAPVAALAESPAVAAARPGGAAPTETAAAMMAAAASTGVVAVVAAVTAPAEAAAAVVGATPAESAAAARAAKFFLLRLPNGRPCLWDTGGVTARSFTLFLLPNEWPRLRPLDPPGPPALAPLGAPVDDMAEKKAGWRGEGIARQGR
jgi:hypothetical protein